MQLERNVIHIFQCHFHLMHQYVSLSADVCVIFRALLLQNTQNILLVYFVVQNIYFNFLKSEYIIFIYFCWSFANCKLQFHIIWHAVTVPRCFRGTWLRSSPILPMSGCGSCLIPPDLVLPKLPMAFPFVSLLMPLSWYISSVPPNICTDALPT